MPFNNGILIYGLFEIEYTIQEMQGFTYTIATFCLYKICEYYTTNLLLSTNYHINNYPVKAAPNYDFLAALYR